MNVASASPRAQVCVPRPSGSVLPLVLLGLLFVVSGLSALIVEQVFEKVLLTVVGSATRSGAVVLGVFFGGLTAGGLLYRKLASWVPHPLRLLLVLELTVAVSGLLLSQCFGSIQNVSALLLEGAGQSPLLLFSARLGISAAWMGVPTVAMGATYPAVVRVLDQSQFPHPARWASVFYALNLLGAVSAAVFGPYLLFPEWGLAVTLARVCAVQAFTAVAAVVVCGRLLPRQAGVQHEAVSRVELSGIGGLLAFAAFSGFLVFSLEVIWYHLIGAVLGMSAYAFATMLAVVLLALFAAGLLVSLLPRRAVTSEFALIVALALSGLSLGWAHAKWPEIPAMLHWDGMLINDFLEGELLRARLAAQVVGIPAFCVGTLYPLLLRSPRIADASRDRVVSLLGVMNALGCIAGSLVAGFLLIEHWGAERSLHALQLATSLGALLLLGQIALRRRRSGWGSERRWALLGLALAGLGAAGPPLSASWDRLALTSGYHVYFRWSHVTPESKLLFWHEDAQSGFVTVTGRDFGEQTVRTLLTNGKFQGNDAGEVVAQTALAALPCLATSGRERALVVGLGTGQSASVVHDAGFRTVEIVEIAQGIVEAAKSQFGNLGGNVLSRPGVQLILEDGRNHLLRTPHDYDLISMEISSIWFAGATNLYSEEYYRLASSRLSPGGMLQQWIQLHHITEREILSVLKTVRRAFAHVELWYVGGQGIILASNSPFEVSPESSEVLDAPAAFRERLRELAADERFGKKFWNGRVLDATDVERLSQLDGIPVNADSNRWLEFATPRYNVTRKSADALVATLLQRLPESERLAARERLELR